MKNAQPQTHDAQWQNGRRNIVNGALVAAPFPFGRKETSAQLPIPREKDNHVPARPPQALTEHDLDGRRLFVEKFGVVAIHDLTPPRDAVGGKFPVLGQGDVLPAPADLLGGKEISRARHPRGAAADRPSAGLEPTGGNEKDPVQARHVVAPEIGGIAVRSNDRPPLFRDERVVHAGDIIFFQHVVCVDDEIAVELLPCAVLMYLVHEVAIRKPHRALGRVVILIDRRALGPRNLRRAVGAVVRDDENAQFFLRIVVVPDAIQQRADNRLLVASADDNAVFQLFLRRRKAPLGKDTDDSKDDVMKEKQAKQPPDRSKNDRYDFQISHNHSVMDYIIIPAYLSTVLQQKADRFSSDPPSV